MDGIITTNQLRGYQTDGTFFVMYDGLTFEYRGMTEQGNGDMLVHLEYADAAGGKNDIEVAKADLDEPYWEA